MNRCIIGWVPWEANSETQFSLQVFYAGVSLGSKAVEGRRRKQKWEEGEVSFEASPSGVSVHPMGEGVELEWSFGTVPHGIKRLGVSTPILSSHWIRAA